jgi:hypothetical protein
MLRLKSLRSVVQFWHIEIAGFVNGIDMVAEDKLFKISDYIKEGKITGFRTTVLLSGKDWLIR